MPIVSFIYRFRLIGSFFIGANLKSYVLSPLFQFERLASSNGRHRREPVQGRSGCRCGRAYIGAGGAFGFAHEELVDLRCFERLVEAFETLGLLLEHVLQIMVLKARLFVQLVVELAFGVEQALDDSRLGLGVILLLSVLCKHLVVEALGCCLSEAWIKL